LFGRDLGSSTNNALKQLSAPRAFDR